MQVLEKQGEELQGQINLKCLEIKEFGRFFSLMISQSIKHTNSESKISKVVVLPVSNSE